MSEIKVDKIKGLQVGANGPDITLIQMVISHIPVRGQQKATKMLLT